MLRTTGFHRFRDDFRCCKIRKAMTLLPNDLQNLRTAIHRVPWFPHATWFPNSCSFRFSPGRSALMSSQKGRGYLYCMFSFGYGCKFHSVSIGILVVTTPRQVITVVGTALHKTEGLSVEASGHIPVIAYHTGKVDFYRSGT